MLIGLNRIFQSEQAGGVYNQQKNRMSEKLTGLMRVKRGHTERVQDALRVGIKQGVDTMCELFLDEFTIDSIVALDDESFSREFDVRPNEKALFIENLRLLLRQCVMDQISLPEYTIRMIYTLIWDSPYRLAGDILGTVASIIIARDVIIYCVETGLLVFTLGHINLNSMIELFNTAYTQCTIANVAKLLTDLGFNNPQEVISYIQNFTKAQLQYFVLTIYLLILKRYSPAQLAAGGNLPPPPPPPPPATIVGEVIDILKRLKDGLFSAGGASIDQILQIRLAQRPSGAGATDNMIDLLAACSNAAGERGNDHSAFLDQQHPRRKVFDGVCCTLNLPVFTAETDEETVGQQLWLLGYNVQTCMTGYLEVPIVVVEGTVRRRIGVEQDSPHRYLTQECIAHLRGKLNTPERIAKLINKFPLCSSLLIAGVLTKLGIKTVEPYDPNDPDSLVVQPGGDSVNQVFIDLPVQVPKPGILCRMVTGMSKMWHKGTQMASATAVNLWPSLEPAAAPPANPMRFVEHSRQLFNLRRDQLFLDIERVGDAEQDPKKKPNIEKVKAAFAQLESVSNTFLDHARGRECTQVQVSLYDRLKDGLTGIFTATSDNTRAFVERAASIVGLEQLECTIAPFIAGATSTTPTLEDAQSLFTMCKSAVEAVCGLSRVSGEEPSEAAKKLAAEAAAEFDKEGKQAEVKFRDAVAAMGNCGGGGGAATAATAAALVEQEVSTSDTRDTRVVGPQVVESREAIGEKRVAENESGGDDVPSTGLKLGRSRHGSHGSEEEEEEMDTGGHGGGNLSSKKSGSKSRKNTKRTRRNKGRKSSKAAKKTKQRRSSRYRRSSRKGRK